MKRRALLLQQCGHLHIVVRNALTGNTHRKRVEINAIIEMGLERWVESQMASAKQESATRGFTNWLNDLTERQLAEIIGQ